jgi:hypothetical protein
MSSKSDFIDWKSHPMTKAVFAALKEREDSVKETLAQTAGENSSMDRYYVGYIAALRDVYLVDSDDVKET